MSVLVLGGAGYIGSHAVYHEPNKKLNQSDYLGCVELASKPNAIRSRERKR